MRGVVLCAAVAVCAAQGAVPQVPLKGSAAGDYSTPQDWVIRCIPGLFVSAYVSTPTPLTLGGLPFGGRGGRSVACNSSAQLTLSFRPDPEAEGAAERVEASWFIDSMTVVPPTSTPTDVPQTDAPDTSTPVTPVPPTSAPPTPAPVTPTPSTPVPTTLPVTPAPPIPLPPTPVTPTPRTRVPLTYAPPTDSLTPVPPTVHHMGYSGSVKDRYSTPQEWVIPCTPDSTVLDISYVPASLKLDGVSVYSGSKRVPCPSSGKVSLLYTTDSSDSHYLIFSWSFATPAPSTPAPYALTVHNVSDHGSVSDGFTAPQEWVISCAPYSTVSITVWNVSYNGQYCDLELNGLPLSASEASSVTCPFSGKISFLFSTRWRFRQALAFSWYTLTSAPSTRAPIRAAVHYVTDSGTVSHGYNTAQQWDISCTPQTGLSIDVAETPSGYTLTLDGSSLSSGSDQRVGCPSSGKVSVLFVPSLRGSYTLKFSWSPVITPAPSTLSPQRYTTAPGVVPPAATVHSMSEKGSINSSYTTPQEWVIPCTPDSSVSVTVTQLSGTLAADTTALHQGERSVGCPSNGHVKLSYVPYPVNHALVMNRALIVSWAPESERSESLLVALIASAGAVLLVGCTVAVCCMWRRRVADSKVECDEDKVECEEGDTGAFGGLHDSCSSPAEQQPMREMDSQLLLSMDCSLVM